MVKKICLSLVFGFFLFHPFLSVSADEYWSETLPLSGGFVQLSEKEFDYFSLTIPKGSEIEVRERGQWRPIELENERDPRSVTSELVTWQRNQPAILRFSGTIPDVIHVDYSRIDPLVLSPGKMLVSSGNIEGLPIYSRSDWGANELWRYDGKAKSKNHVEERESGKNLSRREESCIDAQKKFPDEYEVARVQSTEAGQHLIWPYQYSKRIRKIVIHHTAETGVQDGKTESQVMRGIYRYHTVSRGWGDIGYHFVISPNGNIFEGRAGGDFVVGGHVYCNNIGTIGISLMGNFNEYDPTNAQLEALERLLPRLAKKYELDLTDKEWYHGKETNNLLGHRDLSATACPGENMYKKIPFVRKLLLGTAEIRYTKSFKVDGEPNGSLPILHLKPGESKDIHLAFTNTGEVPWTNSTWLFSQAGKGVKIRSVSKNKNYVAAKQKEQQVLPGETAHFTASIEAGYEGDILTASFVPVVRDKRVKNAETLQVIEVEKPSWGGRFQAIRTQPNPVVTGKPISISVDVRNTGGTRWKKGEISLEVSLPHTRKKTKLILKKTTASGKIGTFTGFLSSVNSSGEVPFTFQLVRKKKRLPVVFVEPVIVKESKNKADLVGFTEKLLLVRAGDYLKKKVRFMNVGNVEWNKRDLKLDVKLRREKMTLSPEEDVIKPGETATFFLDLPISKGVHPYILVLKDGRQRLKAKVAIVRGLRNFRSSGVSVKTPKKQSVKKRTPVVSEGVDTRLIRIKLSLPDNFSLLQVVGEDSFQVHNQRGDLLYPGRKGQMVEIKKIGPLVQFKGNASKVIRVSSNTDDGVLEIANWSRIPAWDTKGSFNDNRFPGTLEFRVEHGKLIVINELSLGQYILGIGETVESDHIEKKKALAVVARNYAAYYQSANHRKFPGHPYDGSDDPREFQKYLGRSLTDRSPGWKKAVEETENIVLRYKDKIIKTPFHTCSGGKTISALEKWGWKDMPYLPSVDDPGCAGKPQRGHGVGLSGGGAEYFAELGKKYREILEYYYPGTKIGK